VVVIGVDVEIDRLSVIVGDMLGMAPDRVDSSSFWSAD
jgi:hypothetical protein